MEAEGVTRPQLVLLLQVWELRLTTLIVIVEAEYHCIHPLVSLCVTESVLVGTVVTPWFVTQDLDVFTVHEGSICEGHTLLHHTLHDGVAGIKPRRLTVSNLLIDDPIFSHG